MKPLKILRTLKEHPLIHLLVNIKGNSKTLLLIEPLFGVPFNLIAPFVTLYMYKQGITDVQIGLILSISMFVQVFFSFSGGIIADKIGRKPATLMGDFFGWGVACFIWAISHNFWLFLAASLMNCFEYINQTTWHCLLIEDADEKDILYIYTWVSIGGLVSVFVAPVSGILIDRFSLIPVIRIFYFCFSAGMITKSFLTYRGTKETRQGTIRKEQTKSIPVWRLIYEYKNVIPQIFKSRATMQMMAVVVILFITNMISGNFFSLYVNTRLGIPERYLAVFPILRALVMLVFMFVIQHKLQHIRIKIPMIAGLVIYVACQVMLILIPKGFIIPVALYIFLEAVANALVMPRKDALLAMSIDPKERARIMALMVSFMVAFSSPFGYLAGFLSSIDRRLPFVFTCSLFLLAIIVVMGIHKSESKQSD